MHALAPASRQVFVVPVFSWPMCATGVKVGSGATPAFGRLLPKGVVGADALARCRGFLHWRLTDGGSGPCALMDRPSVFCAQPTLARLRVGPGRVAIKSSHSEPTLDPNLASMLGIAPDGTPLPVGGWIVDTFEHDHGRLQGFLKVSLEELLIALRDDRDLLNDPGGLLSGAWMQAGHGDIAAFRKSPTLYPDGFSAARFLEVVESEAVWDESGTCE